MRHVAWKGDIALAKVIVTKGGSVEGHDGDKFTPLLGLTGAHRHHNLGILVHLSSISISWSSTTPPIWTPHGEG